MEYKVFDKGSPNQYTVYITRVLHIVVRWNGQVPMVPVLFSYAVIFDWNYIFKLTVNLKYEDGMV